MAVIPYRFLIRTGYNAPYLPKHPLNGKDLVQIPDAGILNPLAEVDDAPRFAQVRVGWCENGLGFHCTVKGKSNPPLGDIDKPQSSDGLCLWIDTRGDRTSHRAQRTCHQFYFLPAGGGENKDQPAAVQTKIHRAIGDAPLAKTTDLLLKAKIHKDGYQLEVFLPASALNGFNPEDYSSLGIFYCVRDFELGDATLNLDANFPYSDDPSLWSSLELVK